LGGPTDIASALEPAADPHGVAGTWLALCGLEFLSVCRSGGHAAT